ncbi:CIA30 family protein [Mesoflavibacter sp. CH_XMU1404-2]|uniref:CIA30 family protein n=1 Tax=Mesoflavibacter sp. CH_XMU1404-2 TaxID=3107766 RepID=UPI00300974A3
MKTLIPLLIFLFMTPLTIIDFNNNSNISNWQVVDDVVMGGKSNGNFQLNKDGYAVFSGDVSLENNGGFSSVQYTFDALNITNYKTVCIKLKGDGNNYQFRLKRDQNDYYSYKKEFKTNGDWQTIKLQLASLQPTYRGRSLDIPNFNSNSIEQLTFLIANKKPQSFKLVLDKIWLE